MYLRSKIVTSFVLTLAVLLSSVSISMAFPDEGMFPPDMISRLPLKQKGLKISPSEIYNPNGTDLSDAVIRLSIGCTAEFVSPQGLILTNHHCAFDALVAASSAENDYGKQGYKADSMQTELPAKNYSLFITNRVADVTSRVRQGTENLTGDALASVLKRNVEKLQAEEQSKAAEGTTITIQPLNSGYYYYLYDTTQIKDVRVVFAPPQNIGYFGGDPDNFEWSRHTGDFTFLRAYVGPDGKSAEYSPNNVPYKPKKFLTISLDGVRENDFVFVLGYPGGTTRYRESQAVEYAQDVNFPFLVEYINAWTSALTRLGEDDEEKRVRLQGEIFSLNNALKLYEGGIIAMKRADILARKRAEEERLAQWINADPQRRAKYGEVLANLERLSRDFYAVGLRDRILRSFPHPGYSPVYKQIFDAVAAVRSGTKLDEKKRAEIEAAFKMREPLLERDMLRFFLGEIADLPAGQKFQAAENIFGKFEGRERRAAEDEFARSIAEGKNFDSPEDIIRLYGMSFEELRNNYPDIVGFAAAHADERGAFAARNQSFGQNIDHWRLLYQQALAEMKNATPYPDANSTLRFTYGNVRGYRPREAVIYAPFTTLKGVLEKDTGVFPFDVPEKLKELQRKQDFGRYGVGDSVPVNFLATTDIIGGNSGSPIFNARGEQVGIVFDGNYEGLGNDIFFNPEYGRSIVVDIRYVLFVTDKFAGAGWILNEMTIKGGPAKAKGAVAAR